MKKSCEKVDWNSKNSIRQNFKMSKNQLLLSILDNYWLTAVPTKIVQKTQILTSLVEEKAVRFFIGIVKIVEKNVLKNLFIQHMDGNTFQGWNDI